MLLTISTTMPSARDLGFLLHKHPDRYQRFSLAFGEGHVFYPEASDDRCSAALLVDVDPIRLTRGRRGTVYTQQHYVSDRPYVASSFLSVAIAQIYGTALGGRCDSHPELAAQRLPLEVQLPVVPCGTEDEIIGDLFEPLGYDVELKRLELASAGATPEASRYCSLALTAEVRLADLLTHLYVLLPVLDDDKHYWVGADEVDKLLRRGAGWLETHPARDAITRRYLRRRRPLVLDALAKLAEADESGTTVDEPVERNQDERYRSLHQQRLGAVLAALRGTAARSVLDLGCGEGRLLELLRAEPQFERITGVDASSRVLSRAARRLRLDTATTVERERLQLLHGALTYRDDRLSGHDAAAVVEVVEHLDQERLSAFSEVIFGHTRPTTIVLTTPNREYNALFDEPRELRHRDHRFEWTRTEFRGWVETISARYGYSATVLPVGPEHPEHGPPSQMAVFNLAGKETAA